MPIPELALFLSEHGITGAPVLDAQGHLMGVVSSTDIAQSEIDHGGVESQTSAYFAAGSENLGALAGLSVKETNGLLVRDIMTPTVFTVPEDTPVHKIARTMITGRIHRVLVTRNERVEGIITSLDMLKLLCE